MCKWPIYDAQLIVKFFTFLFLLLNWHKVIKIESWFKSFILKGLQNLPLAEPNSSNISKCKSTKQGDCHTNQLFHICFSGHIKWNKCTNFIHWEDPHPVVFHADSEAWCFGFLSRKRWPNVTGADPLTGLILCLFMILLKYSPLAVTQCDLTENRWTSLSCKKTAKA